MDTLTIVLACCVLLLLIGFVIYKVAKISKMPKEEKIKTLKTYLFGLVTMAEKEIGAGHGCEKLKLVEDYFNKKAPTAYKFMLKFVGADNLVDLIEEALSEVKKAFSEKGQ